MKLVENCRKEYTNIGNINFNNVKETNLSKIGVGDEVTKKLRQSKSICKRNMWEYLNRYGVN